jgi:hypothetical protein
MEFLKVNLLSEVRKKKKRNIYYSVSVLYLLIWGRREAECNRDGQNDP